MMQNVKARILLIDDDQLVLRTFTHLLTRENFDVIPASSYKEALGAIEEKNFDLIVSDIRMPGKNGVETVSEIQNRLIKAGKKDLPIVFITGYADMGAQLHANFHGEILYKPVNNDFLLATIRDYL